MKLLFLFFIFSMAVFAGGSVTPVAEYLYADVTQLPPDNGRLTVTFETGDSSRLVLAYPRKYRKDRKERSNTTEQERNLFKPRKGTPNQDGTAFSFDRLHPDYYDLLVISPREMRLWEGIAMNKDSLDEESKLSEALAAQYEKEVQSVLGTERQKNRGWEAFFDTKQFNRFEFAFDTCAVLLQQMRLGTALAESGEELQGCIHSLDLVWLRRADKTDDWQVVSRQQMYRDELPQRVFFRHTFLPALCGIRISSKPRTLEIKSGAMQK